jgi:hypothetical protein
VLQSQEKSPEEWTEEDMPSMNFQLRSYNDVQEHQSLDQKSNKKLNSEQLLIKNQSSKGRDLSHQQVTGGEENRSCLSENRNSVLPTSLSSAVNKDIFGMLSSTMDLTETGQAQAQSPEHKECIRMIVFFLPLLFLLGVINCVNISKGVSNILHAIFSDYECDRQDQEE